MTQPKNIFIAVINDSLARHPELAGIPSPVTINHTKYHCHDCNDPCWIGPAQLTIATANPTANVICYTCIITKPPYAEVLQQFMNGEIITADPNADNKPRMWPR